MNHPRSICAPFALRILPLISLIILSACRGEGERVEIKRIPLYEPEFASGFIIDSIEGMHSRLITVRNPWQGADSVEQTIFLSRGGEEMPAGLRAVMVREAPRRIVAMSSSHIAMLDALGEAGRVRGVSGLQYITSPSVRSRSGEVADVGFDGNINYELLAGINPELVVLYGVNGASSMEGKLRELGIPFIYSGDYVEESPLGKAEWMVVFGEILGMREKAVGEVAKIADSYQRIANYVAEKTSARPVVMLNTPYRDSWFLPPNGSYMTRFIVDAGGKYAYEENRSGRSEAVDTERAKMLVANSDRWINVSNASTLSELRRLYPLFGDAKPVKEGEVYSNTLRSTPSGGNDFYEGGVVHPDLILRDIAKILHPDLFTDEDFTYYKKL